PGRGPRQVEEAEDDDRDAEEDKEALQEAADDVAGHGSARRPPSAAVRGGPAGGDSAQISSLVGSKSARTCQPSRLEPLPTTEDDHRSGRTRGRRPSASRPGWKMRRSSAAALACDSDRDRGAENQRRRDELGPAVRAEDDARRLAFAGPRREACQVEPGRGLL